MPVIPAKAGIQAFLDPGACHGLRSAVSRVTLGATDLGFARPVL